MIEVFQTKYFKTMPWKNGGGTTIELYSIQSPFVFRLSVALVEKDGPYSYFENIHRTLILLEGEGFTLQKSRETIQLTTHYSPINFSGEEKIVCSLIKNACRDFNVMINEKWGSTITRIITRDTDLIIHAEDKIKFIYDHNALTLWKISHTDFLEFKRQDNSKLIVVEVYVK